MDATLQNGILTLKVPFASAGRVSAIAEGQLQGKSIVHAGSSGFQTLAGIEVDGRPVKINLNVTTANPEFVRQPK